MAAAWRLVHYSPKGLSPFFTYCSVRWLGMVTRNWERKRFYKQTSVYQNEDGQFGVRLDQRNLRTPLRHLFLVPTESLALAVSREWEAQTEFIHPSLMHLTALCNTVIDNSSTTNVNNAISDALQYLTTDTVCFRASEPEDLVLMQQREWDPILAWFNNRYDANIEPTTSLEVVTCTNELTGRLQDFINSLGSWGVSGFHYALGSCKSLIITCAMFEGRVDHEEATELSRVEVRHQVSKWGLMDHQEEAKDLAARLLASLQMYQLSTGIDSSLRSKNAL